MRGLATRFVLALAAGVLATAQTQPNAKIEKPEIPHLTIVETKALQQAGGSSIILPGKCDEDGNVYVRFYVHPSPLKAPLYKFSPKGERLAMFAVGSDPTFQPKGTGVRDFAIGRDGTVFQLADAEDGSYILSYDRNGNLRSKIRLQIRFTPSRFQPFDSGEFLITGYGRGTAGNPSHAIITAIFAKDGTWIKRIELPEDKPFEEAADRGDAEFIEPGQIQAGNFAIEQGHIARGTDGNLYVVRWTDPARVYAISSSGEIVRTFDVKPPLEGRKPEGIFVHGDHMALEYPPLKDDRRSFITFVSVDGQGEAMYDTSYDPLRERVGGVVCYGERQRLTLYSGGERLQFAEAK